MGYASGTSGVTLGTSSTTLFSSTSGGAIVLYIKARTTNSINGNITVVPCTGGSALVMEAGDALTFANAVSATGYASATSGATFDVAVLKDCQ